LNTPERGGYKDMAENFLVEFVKEYGLKEGIILTKLCEEADRRESDDRLAFTIEDLEKWFKYLTEKQIRTGVGNLLRNKGMEICETEKKEFSRVLHYMINDKVFMKYLKILTKQEARLKR
jgi:hypothetical protein